MGYLSEKVAYLRGLSDGLDIKDAKSEKMVKAIVDTLQEFAEKIDELSDNAAEMQVQIDDIDTSLTDLEDEVFGIDDFDDEDDYEDWDDEEDYSFQCPKCGNMIYVDLNMLDDDENFVVCPECKENIELEFDCDCGLDLTDCDNSETDL